MRLFLPFLFIVLSYATVAQSTSNNALKMKLENRTSLGQIHNLLVQGNVALLREISKEKNFHFNYSAGNIASINCDLNILSELISSKIVSYAEFVAPNIKVLNDTMRKRNRITPVLLGEAPLSQTYDGTGILFGLIDTGIDFNHPDFKDSLGNTRVKFLWDQNPVNGSTIPQPYNYGIEWTASQINASLCTHSDAAYWGHGTHVAGIAAGNALANNTNLGAAPKADIIAVALNFSKSGPTVADAVKYIFDKASDLGRPCVINASLGNYYGSHDGTDLEAKMIDNLVRNIPGRAIVAAVGNAGHIPFHVKTQLTTNDTVFTWFRNNSNTLNYYCYGDTSQIKNLEFSIGANRSNYSDLGNIGFKPYNYGLPAVQNDTLFSNGNRIGIVKTSASINPDGVFELYTQILADTTNLFWRVETAGQGLHHSWNFEFIKAPLPMLSQYPRISKYVLPDTLYTMVSSFQCSDEVITVGNYNCTQFYYDANDTLRDLEILPGESIPFSSLGPTRDGRQKPDISASGHNVFSAFVLSLIPTWLANEPERLAKGAMHVLGGGTSAAAPIVAGVGILYFEKNPNNTNQQIKKAIIDCAYSDNFTGNNLPDYKWGYGKIDGKNTLLCGENLVAIKTFQKDKLKFGPNPFHEKVSIWFPETMINARISVYTLDGKRVQEKMFSGSHFELEAGVLKDYQGLVVLRIESSEKNYTLKLMKD